MKTKQITAIKYSIIIPHKNSTKSLVFCLNSIPVRDDIQVIVVDDNSDEYLVNFKEFPQWKGKNYEFILTKTGLGGGYCRNIGLEHATGKWVLFIDADDFVLPCVDEMFDKYVNCEADIVFFRPKSVMANDRITLSNRCVAYNNIINDWHKSGNDNFLRTLWFAPWSKFIRKSLIDRNGIRFEEIRYSNDCYFSTSTGCRAKSIIVCDDTFYVITESANSLTSNYLNKPGELECRAEAFFRAAQLAYDSGYQYSISNAFNYVGKLFVRDKKLYYKYFRFLMKNLGYTRKKMYQSVFFMYNRKQRYLYFIYSEILLRTMKLIELLQKS